MVRRRSVGESIVGRNFEEDEICLSNLYKQNPSRPIVVVTLTGRPLDLSPYYSFINGALKGRKGVKAIVAAWLPGESGMGVVDVLWGKTSPSARLSIPWSSIPLGWGVLGYNRGYSGCGCWRGPGGIHVALYVLIIIAILLPLLCGCIYVIKSICSIQVEYQSEPEVNTQAVELSS